MEKEQIKTLLIELKKNYRNFEVSDTTTAWWHEAFKDFGTPVVFAAARHWVFTEKWAPSIAELRELCQPPMPGALKIDGLAAWQERNTNPLAKEVILQMEGAYGPWGQWSESENQWRIKEFCERFEERRDRLVIDYKKNGPKALPWIQKSLSSPKEKGNYEMVQQLCGAVTNKMRVIK